MDSLSSPSTPLVFEPNSVYIVFVLREGQPRVGVFHHNSENLGILAFADVELPESRRSHCKVFSLELKDSRSHFSNRTCIPLTSTLSGIESKFTIITTHKVASLRYHEWLRNETFSGSGFVDENLWISDVLCRLDRKGARGKWAWGKWAWGKLVWINRPETEPSEFKKLARLYVPRVPFWIQAFYLRELESSGEWSS